MIDKYIHMLPLLLPIIYIQYWGAALVDTLLVPRFKIRYRRIIVCAVLSVLCWLISTNMASSDRLIFCTLIYSLVPAIFYRSKIFTHLLTFALWMSIYLCSDVICMAVALASNWDLANDTVYLRAKILIVCAISTSILYHILRSALHLIEDRLDTKAKTGLVITTLATISLAFLILLNACGPSIAQGTWFMEILPIANSIGILLPLIIMAGILALIHQMNRSIRESEEARWAQQQAQYELSQNKVLITKDQQYHQLRHDIKNHLLAIDALAQKGEHDRLHDYLNSLNVSFAQTQQKQYCGNPLIDSIFEAKNLRMQQSNIQIKWNLQPVPENLHLSDLDLCALLGNILDNAIEACERLESDADRNITVTLRINEQSFIMRTTNTCDDAQKALGMGKFSQKRLHRGGTGLRSIKRVVDANNGELLLVPSDDNHNLEVSVYLPVA